MNPCVVFIINDDSGASALPLLNNRHVTRAPSGVPPITWNSALYITRTIKQMFTQLMNKHAESMGNLSHGPFDHDLTHSIHYTLVTELQCCSYSLHMGIFIHVTKKLLSTHNLLLLPRYADLKMCKTTVFCIICPSKFWSISQLGILFDVQTSYIRICFFNSQILCKKEPLRYILVITH
jgi:hypothetical protein